MVRDFQSVIGREARAQNSKSGRAVAERDHRVCWRWLERDRDFYEFLKDKKVKLVGVEAGGRGLALGEQLLGSPGGRPECFQGTYSYFVARWNQVKLRRRTPFPRGSIIRPSARARRAAR